MQKLCCIKNKYLLPMGQLYLLEFLKFPINISIEKCNLHHCRRLGVSLTGGKHIIIKECNIHHIKGTNPQSGIDIEDARDLNQYILY